VASIYISLSVVFRVFDYNFVCRSNFPYFCIPALSHHSRINWPDVALVEEYGDAVNMVYTYLHRCKLFTKGAIRAVCPSWKVT
jgi:hypothetical protein